jgi:S1-C subfamily serine protease
MSAVILGHPPRIGTTGKILALAVTLACATPLAGSARAEDSDRSLLLNAVAINQDTHFRSGVGIYLGNGFVLTASHVVGRAPLGVTIAGRDLPARVIKQDSFEQSDLALLAIDEGQLPVPLRPKRVSLCRAPPWAGEDIVTVVPEEIVHSQVLSPVWLPREVRKYGTVISDVARTGNSGSGVFDAKDNCLLGIMSRKITESFSQKKSETTGTIDIAKYFIPASVITAFLPKGIIDPLPASQ